MERSRESPSSALVREWLDLVAERSPCLMEQEVHRWAQSDARVQQSLLWEVDCLVEVSVSSHRMDTKPGKEVKRAKANKRTMWF